MTDYRLPEAPSVALPAFTDEQLHALADYMEQVGRARGHAQHEFNEVDFLMGCASAFFALGRQDKLPARWVFGPMSNESALGLPKRDLEAEREREARDKLRYQTVYAMNPDVYYEPFIADGRVGYRCATNDEDEQRETFIYFVPSDDTDDGVPNVFVYEGGDNDPAIDGSIAHFAIDHLISPPREARA